VLQYVQKTNGECGIFQLLLDCMITNNTNNISEINPELHGKSSIQQEEKSFTRNLDLNLRKKLVNCYILRISLYGTRS